MSAWDFLRPDALRAGPRRVMVTPDRPQGYVICDQPPPHVPPLPERYAPQGEGACYPPTTRAAWEVWMGRAMRKRPGEPA